MKQIAKLMSYVLMGVSLMMAVACGDKDNEKKDVIINAMSNNDDWGTVSGTGAYAEGETVTLTATAAEGYQFLQWQDGNTDNPRTFEAKENGVYTAQFGLIPQGDGTCKVTWHGETWEAQAIYLTVGQQMGPDYFVELEIFKDASDTTQPMIALVIPMAVGSRHIAQMAGGDATGVFPYDYPSQYANYNGEHIYPYDPTDATVNIIAIDPVNGVVQGTVTGSFINVQGYLDGTDQSQYQLSMELNACHWIDVR